MRWQTFWLGYFMDTEVVDDYITQWYYGQDAQFGRADYAQSIANVPENAVNLKGNEAHTHLMLL